MNWKGCFAVSPRFLIFAGGFSCDTVKKIADALGVSLDVLMK